jgi:hypothetical protein
MANGRPRRTAFQLVLGICPLLIALLWLVGVARFRAYELTGREWAAVVAVGFALHLLSRRALRPRPLPVLPATASPNALAALAASVLACIAAVVGGVLEWLVEPSRPSEVSWPLRTTWHAACAFGASYCTFLARLQQALARQSAPKV